MADPGAEEIQVDLRRIASWCVVPITVILHLQLPGRQTAVFQEIGEVAKGGGGVPDLSETQRMARARYSVVAQLDPPLAEVYLSGQAFIERLQDPQTVAGPQALGGSAAIERQRIDPA